MTKKIALATLLVLFLFACNNTNAPASSRPVEIVAYGFNIAPEFSSDRPTNESVAAHIEGNIESFLKAANVRYTHITATVQPSGVQPPQHGAWRRYLLRDIRVDGQLITENILGADMCEVGKKAAEAIEKFRTTKSSATAAINFEPTTSFGMQGSLWKDENLPRGEWTPIEGSLICVKTRDGHIWVINFYRPNNEGKFQVVQLRDDCKMGEFAGIPLKCIISDEYWTWKEAKAFMATAVNPSEYDTFVKNVPPHLKKQFYPITVE